MMQEQRHNLQTGIKKRGGYSLIEILVVLALFVILMLITTQTLATSLGGVRKSEAIFRVRGEAGRAAAIIERHLHNGREIVCAADNSRVDYVDPEGSLGSFSCQTGFIASGSARLTSSEINVTACSFVCIPQVDRTPPSVTLSLTAEDVENIAEEGSEISTSTTIFLRTY